MTIEAGRVVIQSLSKNKQWSQWLAVFSASITLFTTGVCFTWTSPTLVILQSPDSPFNITNSDASWIASLMPFGSALGPILGSLLARQLGPKQTIMISSAPFLLGFVLIILAKGPGLLCASRFISGIGVGFGFSSVPIFIGEVAENHNRGALMILFTSMLSLGSLFMACVGPFITIQLMATIALVFPLLTLALLSFIPDSPFFLMRIEKEKKAISSLMWFRRQNDYKSIESELDSIKETVKNNQMSFFDCFKNITVKPNPKALLIILLAVLGQQFSGVLAVAFYQEQIYRDSRVPINPVLAVILSLVISNLAGLSSIFLVDRCGRKPLLLLSSLGCGISTALLGTYFQLSYLQDSHPNVRWLPIVAMNMLQISFSMGLGPIPYTILGEIFSSNFKEVAICLISVSGALAGTLVAKLFQIINDSFGSSVIFFSVSICTFSLLLVNWIVIPETMNKSLLEIQNMLTGNSDKKSDIPAEGKENNISTKTRIHVRVSTRCTINVCTDDYNRK